MPPSTLRLGVTGDVDQGTVANFLPAGWPLSGNPVSTISAVSECHVARFPCREQRRLEIHPQIFEEIRSHREKDYAGAAIGGQHPQLGFQNHGLMISRMLFMVEMACKRSGGAVSLEAWCQGGQVAGHKADVPKVRSSKVGGEFFWQEVDENERLPVEPDALFTLRFADRAEGHHLTHYCYEADRGSMVMTDMLKKFRGYYHFIKKQQEHREAFGVHPIRAVLVETTDEARGKKLMDLVGHPLVAGPGKRAGLFWFSISPLFTDPTVDSPVPRYLDQPEAILEPIWALPDHSLHALGDTENAHSAPSQASPRFTDAAAQLYFNKYRLRGTPGPSGGVKDNASCTF